MRMCQGNKLACMLAVLVLLTLEGCGSLQRLVDSDISHLACKFELIVPLEAGVERVSGTIRLKKDHYIQVSFRAPMVRSELVYLEYKQEDLLVIDRTNKQFAQSTYPVLNKKGISILSFTDLQEKIIQAATSNRKQVYLFASEFGWPFLENATVELYQFDNQEFSFRRASLSKKYKQVSMDILLSYLGV